MLKGIKAWFLRISVMAHTNLTRWIEEADARHVCEAAMFDQSWSATECHRLHLGFDILATPRRYLRNFGGHALACARHPLRGLHR